LSDAVLKALHPHHFTKQLPETDSGSGLLFIYIDLVVVGLVFATFRKGFAGVFATFRKLFRCKFTTFRHISKKKRVFCVGVRLLGRAWR
jgi:hypothetical protein